MIGNSLWTVAIAGALAAPIVALPIIGLPLGKLRLLGAIAEAASYAEYRLRTKAWTLADATDYLVDQTVLPFGGLVLLFLPLVVILSARLVSRQRTDWGLLFVLTGMVAVWGELWLASTAWQLAQFHPLFLGFAAVPLLPLVVASAGLLMDGRRRAWLLTVCTTAGFVAYTVLGFGLDFLARRIALPTRGGISPSEVIEGIIPGGLSTLLFIWLLLLGWTILVWLVWSGRAAVSLVRTAQDQSPTAPVAESVE